LNFLIIGAGAIGCLVGGKLAQQGHDVTLVGRPHFADQVSENGLILVESDQRRQIENITAVGSIGAAAETMPATSEYVAIVTVKGYDTETVCHEFKAAQMIPTCLLSLQNGVGNEALLADHFGIERIIAGVINTPVSVEAPGIIAVEKAQYAIGMSPLSSAEEPQAEDMYSKIYRALEQAGFEMSHCADPRSLKWTKLLMNIMGNASSAILDASPQQTFAQDNIVDLEIAAWREALAVMRAAQIAPINIGSYPFKQLAPLIRHAPKILLRSILRKQINKARGGKMPSLHIDLAKGKPNSEVSLLNGAVVKMGQALQVPTPANALLCNTLLALVANPQSCADWRKNYEKLRV